MSAAFQRRLSWLAVVAGLAIAVALFVWLVGEQAREAARGAASAVSPGPAPAAPHRGHGVPPRPRLEIPKIGVSAHVVDLGLNRDGSLEVPKDYSAVGLWTGGTQPGERGPAVLAGHVDSPTEPAVFYRLPRLRRGDRVRWFGENGVVATFVVTGSEEHPKARFPTSRVYGKTRRPELRLITCTGPADRSRRRALDNLIVFARKA
jgi:hypothetical protein